MTVDPGPEDTPYEYITKMAEKNRRSILGDPAERPSDAQHLSTRLSQLYAGDGVTHLGSWETCHAMIGMSIGAIVLLEIGELGDMPYRHGDDRIGYRRIGWEV